MDCNVTTASFVSVMDCMVHPVWYDGIATANVITNTSATVTTAIN